MEPKLQTKLEDKVKVLKKVNRRLTKELNKVNSELGDCKDSKVVLEKRVVLLENVVLQLVEKHYGNDVRADFIRHELCINQNCIKFEEYEDFLVALRILPLLIQ